MFLERAIVSFTAHGVPRIERWMTDDTWAPNGKVEHLDPTVATAWAYRPVLTTHGQRAAALAPWLEYHATGRRHSALGGRVPVSWLPT